MNEVIKAIQDRRSTRGFNDVQLTEQELQVLVDAALASPTARNTQNWHFSFVQNAELLNKASSDLAAMIAARLPEGARGRFEDNDFHVFYNAPTVVFISHPAECDNSFVEVDCGIACENIVLAAQSMGLGSVIIGMVKDLFLSDKGEEYKKAFDFPEGNVFSIAISIGHNTVSKEAHPIGDNKISFIK